jgi:hypothetical protein
MTEQQVPPRPFAEPNAKRADPLGEVAAIWADFDTKVGHLRDERAKLDSPKTTAWWRGHRQRQLAHWLRRAEAERHQALVRWVGTQLASLDREPTADDLALLQHLCERPQATLAKLHRPANTTPTPALIASLRRP